MIRVAHIQGFIAERLDLGDCFEVAAGTSAYDYWVSDLTTSGLSNI